ncbi:MAG TPA: DUF6036 family nucleotidyltransferase [Bdellovibrionota bacterium]|nr:DUF6036 family nucleotidyltransferase [Bdellovibrionota bacterium]
MSHTPLQAESMLRALKALDARLDRPVSLLVGGGGAMLLAHGFKLATTDIDAVPKGISLAELDVHVKGIASELGFAPDWLNPYYGSFTHTLPADFESRTIEVFKGRQLQARALGKNEMLIMKCYAHRPKDVSHALTLIRQGADVDGVERHIESLLRHRIPDSQEALDFLQEVVELGEA